MGRGKREIKIGELGEKQKNPTCRNDRQAAEGEKVAMSGVSLPAQGLRPRPLRKGAPEAESKRPSGHVCEL